MFRRSRERVWGSITAEPWLWGVLALALLLRLPALGYGLPLMLVNDEPPFTLAALKMLELHTLIPALHLAAFQSVLYYPPYLAYLYLPFFVGIIGATYLLHGGALLSARLAADLTPFFVAARLLNLAIALASIYLVYRVAERLFASRLAALVAAFLLATSLLHLGLSVVARQWMPVASILLFVFYLLLREDLAERRRYFWVLITAGVGMGFSAVAAFALPLAGLYWWCCGTAPLRALVRDGALWAGAAGFLALAALPSILYPGSSGFAVDLTLGAPKSLGALLTAPWHEFALTLYSEPVLMLLAALGIGILFFARARLALLFAGWFVAYAAVFYIVFRFESRFALPLVPLYALLGGYAVARLRDIRHGSVIVCILLALPLAASLRLGYLGAASDTRAQAREWVLAHLAPTDSILVFAPLTRVSTGAAAVGELAALAPEAVRATDQADATLERPSLPHALNLYNVRQDAFFAALPAYARAHGYTYLLLDPGYAAATPASAAAFAALTASSTVVRQWHGRGAAASLTDSSFPAPVWQIFSSSGSLGPNMVLYQLHV